jgi:restriction endonuclease Mrr
LDANVKADERQPLTATDLIERLRSIDWFQFEEIVALVYRKLGYNVIRRGGANPDGGFDLALEKGASRRQSNASSGRRGMSV